MAMSVKLEQIKTETITLPDTSVVQQRVIKVNGRLITFIDGKLPEISKNDLSDGEREAAKWFVNNTLKIQSSVFGMD